jgi:hypothetical protein
MELIYYASEGKTNTCCRKLEVHSMLLPPGWLVLEEKIYLVLTKVRKKWDAKI